MAYFDLAWYVNFGDGSTTGYFSITKWAASTAYSVGNIRRQLAAPAQGNERAFVCIVAGTSAGSEPTWTITRGAKTTDNTVTWMECTGASAVNGDISSSPTWTSVKNQAVSQGQIISRNNGVSYQICTTAGTAGNGSEPTFSDTAGVTTADNTITWTSLGAVGNYSAWGAPGARLDAGGGLIANWAAAGNNVFVGDNHNETNSGGLATSSTGTVATPIYVLCVDHTVVNPGNVNLKTTAVIAQSTNSTSLTLNFTGIYIYGINFTVNTGVGGNTSITMMNLSSAWAVFEKCTFKFGSSSGAGSVLSIGPTASQSESCYVEWRNCTYKATNAGHIIGLNRVQFIWRQGGVDATSTSPTILITSSVNSASAQYFLEGLDLNACTGTLMSDNANFGHMNGQIKDCRINSNATIGATPAYPSGIGAVAHRCDSQATNYGFTIYRYQATESTEINITRVNGATAPDSQQMSRKIVTTANAKFILPYEGPGLVGWSNTTGANVTVTVYGTWNQVFLPNNDDIWLEVEYLGGLSNPKGSFATLTKASFLAANAALPADTSVWNSGGSGAGWSPFKMQVVLSSPQPQLKGLIFGRIKVARPSSTFYIDPQLVLS